MDTGATDHITGELEKLTIHDKYNGKDQIHTTSGARMEGYLTGTTQVLEAEIDVKQGDKTIKGSNPAYEEWVATYQQVLGYLLSSLSREILTQVAVFMATT